LLSAIALDTAALTAFLVIKGRADPLIVSSAILAIGVIFGFEKFYLSRRRPAQASHAARTHGH
jgi:hypothetical protein